LGECGGNCEADVDQDGVCDIDEIFGCTDELACNYDAEATQENGTCFYDCYGCTDPSACNFDIEAIFDDGGCIMPGDACNDGLILTEGDFIQSDCSCSGYGCTDPGACNYIETALTDNSVCIYIGNYSITGALSSSNDMIVEYSYPNTNGSTYEWIIVNGDITSGEGTSLIEVVWWGDFEGQLCVIETNADSCSGNMACINVTIFNSVEEILGIDLNVYPNPARDVLNVELMGRHNMVIVDVVGRMVWHGEIIDKGQIDLTSLERGTYLINANVDGIWVIQRFIVH
ncbi:MAG: hypothetical protein CL847_05105, partial [Crocinitomicaceae bacterium]|nr:hypothetical protein [Crocinitomicaceae bacterium]